MKYVAVILWIVALWWVWIGIQAIFDAPDRTMGGDNTRPGERYSRVTRGDRLIAESLQGLSRIGVGIGFAVVGTGLVVLAKKG